MALNLDVRLWFEDHDDTLSVQKSISLEREIAIWVKINRKVEFIRRSICIEFSHLWDRISLTAGCGIYVAFSFVEKSEPVGNLMISTNSLVTMSKTGAKGRGLS